MSTFWTFFCLDSNGIRHRVPGEAFETLCNLSPGDMESFVSEVQGQPCGECERNMPW